ncbi:hypothetical protein [Chitinophaga niabensis]|uniref:Uncharacterized protein n=1 Tax=Chitinophaga niabensis TaxID=536979 RepID=A0A1N6DF53_9BACT|nr:hypothetical protein [Chitinophaga niabensis]SIN69422.1 hypothetical protein SAMN04488055_0686 [Chitinophaga niabensis]
MAKQTGPIKISGTVGNICFYKTKDGYYARLKSSLTGKRVKKDPRFKRTMEYAGMLVAASRLASRCYGSLPEEERVHAVYRKMTGMAMQMLKMGMEAEDIAIHLRGVYKEEEKIAVARPRMYVDPNGTLIFCLSCSKTDTVRLKTGQSSHQYPLIINAVTTGIPFVPD